MSLIIICIKNKEDSRGAVTKRGNNNAKEEKPQRYTEDAEKPNKEANQNLIYNKIEYKNTI